MGWASGSELAERVWDAVRDHLPEGNTKRMTARKIIKAFESHDCDTLDEAQILCKDAGKKQWNTDMTWEEWDALPEYCPLEKEKTNDP